MVYTIAEPTFDRMPALRNCELQTSHFPRKSTSSQIGVPSETFSRLTRLCLSFYNRLKFSANAIASLQNLLCLTLKVDRVITAKVRHDVLDSRVNHSMIGIVV